MGEGEMPQGKLYGELYLPKGPPKQDDARFRVRLLVLVQKIDGPVLAGWVKQEMGLVVRQAGVEAAYDFDAFVTETLTWVDLLHFITIVTKLLLRLDLARSSGGSRITGAHWIEGVQHLLTDQNMAWRVDPKGGVHPVEDGVMIGERAAVLAGLGNVRYANVRREVELALEAFDTIERPNHKRAVRHTFQAAEGLFRLMFDQAERLTASAVRARLRPEVNREGQNTTAAKAGEHLVEAFANWTDALQPYRHELGVKDVVHQPPPDLATVMMGQGLSYIRWLITIDQKNVGGTPTD